MRYGPLVSGRRKLTGIAALMALGAAGVLPSAAVASGAVDDSGRRPDISSWNSIVAVAHTRSAGNLAIWWPRRDGREPGKNTAGLDEGSFFITLPQKAPRGRDNKCPEGTTDFWVLYTGAPRNRFGTPTEVSINNSRPAACPLDTEGTPVAAGTRGVRLTRTVRVGGRKVSRSRTVTARVFLSTPGRTSECALVLRLNGTVVRVGASVATAPFNGRASCGLAAKFASKLRRLTSTAR